MEIFSLVSFSVILDNKILPEYDELVVDQKAQVVSCLFI
jgi:hypothetical protein